MSFHRPFKMLVALCTSVTFLATSLGVSPGAFAAAAMPEVSLPYQAAIDRDLRLSIPQELGKLESFNPGAGDQPAIFHIQTAHGHYEAQQKVRKILHYLFSQYGVKTVLVEGSAFQLDSKLLNFFPKDPSLTQKINDELTKRALVKGPELYLLDSEQRATSHEPQEKLEPRATYHEPRKAKSPAWPVDRGTLSAPKAYGIENLKSYRENGLAFVEVLDQKEKTSQFLADMDMQIERLTGRFLNKDLRDFLRRVEGFEKNKIPLDVWLKDLKGEAQKSLEIDLSSPAQQLDWPMMVRFFKMQELAAKLDLQKFPKERETFLKAAKRFVPVSLYGEVERFLTSEQMSRQLPDPETGLLFEDMVKHLPENFNYDAFPNVRFFIGTLLLQSELKADRLFVETKALSAAISGKLTRNQGEKQLVALLADHRLLQKLFALELMPEDYDVILARSVERGAQAGGSLKPSLIVKSFENAILHPSASIRQVRSVQFYHIEALDALYEKAMKFYAGVKERDGAMEQRIEERLRETGANKVAVITGGFHSRPFGDYFSSRNCTYALISPKLTSADDAGHAAYEQNMLRFAPRATHPVPRELAKGTAGNVKEATREFEFLSDPQVLAGAYAINAGAMRSEVRKVIREIVGRAVPVTDGLTEPSRTEMKLPEAAALDVESVASTAEPRKGNLLLGITRRQFVQGGALALTAALLSARTVLAPEPAPSETGLSPEQKEIVGKLIESYDSVFQLGVTVERKAQIIESLSFFDFAEQRAQRMRWSFAFQIVCGAAVAFGLFAVLVTFVSKAFSWSQRLLFLAATAFFSKEFVGAISSHQKVSRSIIDGSHDPETNEIRLDKVLLSSTEQDFIELCAHEVAHFLKLPNHRLLANAYALLIAAKIGARTPGVFSPEQYAGYFIGAIPDPVKREATVRKIVAHGESRDKLMTLPKEERPAYIQSMSSTIKDPDYDLPFIQSEYNHPWVYFYGVFMGEIARLTHKDGDDALRYIYQLGQAKDPRELRSGAAHPSTPRPSSEESRRSEIRDMPPPNTVEGIFKLAKNGDREALAILVLIAEHYSGSISPDMKRYFVLETSIAEKKVRIISSQALKTLSLSRKNDTVTPAFLELVGKIFEGRTLQGFWRLRKEVRDNPELFVQDPAAYELVHGFFASASLDENAVVRGVSGEILRMLEAAAATYAAQKSSGEIRRSEIRDMAPLTTVPDILSLAAKAYAHGAFSLLARIAKDFARSIYRSMHSLFVVAARSSDPVVRRIATEVLKVLKQPDSHSKAPESFLFTVGKIFKARSFNGFWQLAEEVAADPGQFVRDRAIFGLIHGFFALTSNAKDATIRSASDKVVALLRDASAESFDLPGRDETRRSEMHTNLVDSSTSRPTSEVIRRAEMRDMTPIRTVADIFDLAKNNDREAFSVMALIAQYYGGSINDAVKVFFVAKANASDKTVARIAKGALKALEQRGNKAKAPAIFLDWVNRTFKAQSLEAFMSLAREVESNAAWIVYDRPNYGVIHNFFASKAISPDETIRQTADQVLKTLRFAAEKMREAQKAQKSFAARSETRTAGRWVRGGVVAVVLAAMVGLAGCALPPSQTPPQVYTPPPAMKLPVPKIVKPQDIKPPTFPSPRTGVPSMPSIPAIPSVPRRSEIRDLAPIRTVADIFQLAKGLDSDAFSVMALIAQYYGGSINDTMKSFFVRRANSSDRTVKRIASGALGALKTENNKERVPPKFLVWVNKTFKAQSRDEILSLAKEVESNAAWLVYDRPIHGVIRAFFALKAISPDESIRQAADQVLKSLRFAAAKMREAKKSSDARSEIRSGVTLVDVVLGGMAALGVFISILVFNPFSQEPKSIAPETGQPPIEHKLTVSPKVMDEQRLQAAESAAKASNKGKFFTVLWSSKGAAEWKGAKSDQLESQTGKIALWKGRVLLTTQNGQMFSIPITSVLDISIAEPPSGKPNRSEMRIEPLSGKTPAASAGRSEIRGLALLDTPAPKKEFVSPVKAGVPVSGAFMPFHHQRSEGDWGIGDFETDLEAIDLYQALGLHVRQHLPLSWSGAYNSPYSEGSSRAIDPRFISIPLLINRLRTMAKNRLIQMDFTAIDQFMTDNASEIKRLNALDEIDHEGVVKLKMQALRILWDSFRAADSNSNSIFDSLFQNYKKDNKSWLPDHMLYFVLKDKYFKEDPTAGWDWRTWEERDVHDPKFQDAKKQKSDEIEFLSFVQFVADSQLQFVKEKGREKGVEIAVDMPFGRDGADVWLHPEIFGLKKENGYQRPVTLGVPAEPAYPAGQYWQFYPYDWGHPETVPYLLDLFEFYQSRATYVRLDHVLGFYRNFLFTEDVDGTMGLANVEIVQPLQKVRDKAMTRIATEKEPALIMAIQDEAIRKAKEIIFGKLRSLKPGQVPSLPVDAVALAFQKDGTLSEDAMVLIAREVPEDQWGIKLPETSPWKRQEVVEKKVFTRRPVWDFISIAQDEGMREWLFGDNPGPLSEDSLRLAYFKWAPGEAILSEFLRLAQEKGTVLIFETLGVVPQAIQDTGARLQGYNYLPVIWGFHDGSSYHPSVHTPNSLAVFGLHDSPTLRARWEVEFSVDEKKKILKELFPNMKPAEYQKFLGALSPEAHQALLEMVFKSQALMAIPTWLDLLGYTNERRLNSPGKASGQWERRLRVTIGSFLAAAKGDTSDPEVSKAIKLFKHLVQIRNEGAVVPGGALRGTDPDTKSGLIQIRIIPKDRPTHPFLVEALVKNEVREVKILVADKDGNTAVYPMKPAVTEAGLEKNVTRYAVQLMPAEAGAYRYYIQVTKRDGTTEESQEGFLVAAREGDDLNPLSPDYVTSRYIEALSPSAASGVTPATPTSRSEMRMEKVMQTLTGLMSQPYGYRDDRNEIVRRPGGFRGVFSDAVITSDHGKTVIQYNRFSRDPERDPELEGNAFANLVNHNRIGWQATLVQPKDVVADQSYQYWTWQIIMTPRSEARLSRTVQDLVNDRAVRTAAELYLMAYDREVSFADVENSLSDDRSFSFGRESWEESSDPLEGERAALAEAILRRIGTREFDRIVGRTQTAAGSVNALKRSLITPFLGAQTEWRNLKGRPGIVLSQTEEDSLAETLGSVRYRSEVRDMGVWITMASKLLSTVAVLVAVTGVAAWFWDITALAGVFSFQTFMPANGVSSLLLVSLGLNVFFVSRCLKNKVESEKQRVGREATERALVANEAKHKERAALSPIGIFETDLSGVVEYANEMAFRIFGYAPEDVAAGLTVAELLAPEDRDRGQRRLREILEKGESGEVPAAGEYMAVRKDGTLFPVSIFTLVRSKYGKPVGFRGAIRDITERKAAEKALAEREAELKASHALLSSVTEHAPGAIYQFKMSPEGHFSLPYGNANFTRAFGIPPKDLEADASGIFNSMHPEDRQKILISIRESARTMGLWNQEFRVVLPDGTVAWRSARSRPEQLEDGSIVWHGFVMDITERKRAEEILHDSQELMRHQDRLTTIETLIAGVTHELNNPIAIMLGLGELMGNSLASRNTVEAEKHLGNILENLRNTRKIVQDFVRSVRPQTVADNASVFPIARAIQTALDHSEIGQVGLTLQIDDALKIYGDEETIVQAFVNLIKNAIQSPKSDAEKNITLKASVFVGTDSRKMIRVLVRDNGLGADSAERWFDPFYTSKDRSQATGLGLPLVKTYIEEVGGSIRVTTAVGKGTTFEILIPEATQSGRGASDQETDPAAQGISGVELRQIQKILVVDDESSIGVLYQRYLGDAGYEVVWAASGKVALDLLDEQPHRDRPFDLVITDYSMPEMNGAAFARAFRITERKGDSKKEKTPVVMLTSYEPGAQQHDEALGLQAQGVLDGVRRKELNSEPLRDLVAQMKRMPLSTISEATFSEIAQEREMSPRSAAAPEKEAASLSDKPKLILTDSKLGHDINNVLTSFSAIPIIKIPGAEKELRDAGALAEAMLKRVRSAQAVAKSGDVGSIDEAAPLLRKLISEYQEILELGDEIANLFRGIEDFPMPDKEKGFVRNIHSAQERLRTMLQPFLEEARQRYAAWTAPQIEARVSVVTPAPASPSVIRILFADDEDSINFMFPMLFKAVLTDSGSPWKVEIDIAESGEKALEAIKAKGVGYYDGVILDNNFNARGKISGLEVGKILKEEQSYKGLLILSSGAPHEGSEKWFQTAILKPFESGDLRKLILEPLVAQKERESAEASRSEVRLSPTVRDLVNDTTVRTAVELYLMAYEQNVFYSSQNVSHHTGIIISSFQRQASPEAFDGLSSTRMALAEAILKRMGTRGFDEIVRRAKNQPTVIGLLQTSLVEPFWRAMMELPGGKRRDIVRDTQEERNLATVLHIARHRSESRSRLRTESGEATVRAEMRESAEEGVEENIGAWRRLRRHGVLGALIMGGPMLVVLWKLEIQGVLRTLLRMTLSPHQWVSSRAKKALAKNPSGLIWVLEKPDLEDTLFDAAAALALSGKGVSLITFVEVIGAVLHRDVRKLPSFQKAFEEVWGRVRSEHVEDIENFVLMLIDAQKKHQKDHDSSSESWARHQAKIVLLETALQPLADRLSQESGQRSEMRSDPTEDFRPKTAAKAEGASSKSAVSSLPSVVSGEAVRTSDSFEVVPAGISQAKEVLALHNEKWAANKNKHMVFKGKIMRDLIQKGRVYLLRDKTGDQTVRGVLLTHPMKTGGDIEAVRKVPLWKNMMEGNDSEGPRDTVFFWGISVAGSRAVPGVNAGQVFAKLAVQHFLKDFTYVRTFSPIVEKEYDSFKKKLVGEGLTSAAIKKYGIYLYLAAEPQEGAWNYVEHIQRNPFVTPEAFFKSTIRKFRDQAENFHVGRNGATILGVLPQKRDFTRPDGPFTAIYGYGPGESDENFRLLSGVPLPGAADRALSNGSVSRSRVKTKPQQLKKAVLRGSVFGVGFLGLYFLRVLGGWGGARVQRILLGLTYSSSMALRRRAADALLENPAGLESLLEVKGLENEIFDAASALILSWGISHRAIIERVLLGLSSRDVINLPRLAAVFPGFWYRVPESDVSFWEEFLGKQLEEEKNKLKQAGDSAWLVWRVQKKMKLLEDALNHVSIRASAAQSHRSEVRQGDLFNQRFEAIAGGMLDKVKMGGQSLRDLSAMDNRFDTFAIRVRVDNIKSGTAEAPAFQNIEEVGHVLSVIQIRMERLYQYKGVLREKDVAPEGDRPGARIFSLEFSKLTKLLPAPSRSEVRDGDSQEASSKNQTPSSLRAAKTAPGSHYRIYRNPVLHSPPSEEQQKASAKQSVLKSEIATPQKMGLAMTDRDRLMQEIDLTAVETVARWFSAGILSLRVVLAISRGEAMVIMARLGIHQETVVKLADHLTPEDVRLLEEISSRSLAISRDKNDKVLAGGVVFMGEKVLIDFARHDASGFYPMLSELAGERSFERPIVTAGDAGTLGRIAQVLLNKNSGLVVNKTQVMELLNRVIKVEPVKGDQVATINELAEARHGGMVTILSSEEMLAVLHDGANFAFKDHLAKDNVKFVLRTLLGRMRVLAAELDGASEAGRVKFLEDFTARVGGLKKAAGGFVFDVLQLVQSFLAQEAATAKSA